MKAKLIAFVILLIPVGIFVYQNLEQVTVTFLRWSTGLPQALLLLIALVLGYLLGVIQMWLRGRRKRKQQKLAEEQAEREQPVPAAQGVADGYQDPEFTSAYSDTIHSDTQTGERS